MFLSFTFWMKAFPKITCIYSICVSEETCKPNALPQEATRQWEHRQKSQSSLPNTRPSGPPTCPLPALTHALKAITVVLSLTLPIHPHSLPLLLFLLTIYHYLTADSSTSKRFFSAPLLTRSIKHLEIASRAMETTQKQKAQGHTVWGRPRACLMHVPYGLLWTRWHFTGVRITCMCNLIKLNRKIRIKLLWQWDCKSTLKHFQRLALNEPILKREKKNWGKENQQTEGKQKTKNSQVRSPVKIQNKNKMEAEIT